MSLTFVGMLVGLLVDVLLAAKFGTSQSTDVLIVALSLPLLIDTVAREGSKFSMVPLFVEKRINDPAEFQRFTSAVLNAALLLGAAIWLAGMLSASWIVVAIGPGLTPEGQREASRMFLACAPILAIAPAITVQNVIQSSMKRFQVVALRNSIAPSIVVIALLLSWRRTDAAIWVAAAYSTGYFVYFIMVCIALRTTGRRHVWGAWISWDELAQLRRIISWPTLGFSVAQGVLLAERAIASLVSIGGVSSYYFAFRIYSGIQTIIGTSIATTGLPELAETSATGQPKDLSQHLRRRIIQAILLALPVVLCIVTFNGQIVDTIYGRGEFGQVAIQSTRSLLPWFGIAILFAAVLPIVNSGLYAVGAIRTVFANMLLTSTVRISLAWLLAKTLGFGLQGIAAAVAVAVASSFVSLLYLSRRQGIDLWRS